MSIQLIVNANSFPELASLLAGFHLTPPPAIEVEQPAVEEVNPPRKASGRRAKQQTIEGTAEPVATTEQKLAEEAEATPDTGATEAETVEASPVPEITHEELRTKIIAWVNDKAAKTPDDADARRKAFDALRKEFDFAKVPEIDPSKFDGILAYLEANAP